jgi:hypothetical protein
MYGEGYGGRSEHHDWRTSNAKRSDSESESERARKGGPLGGEIQLAEDALRRINKLLDASKDSHRQELVGDAGGAGDHGDVRISRDARWRESDGDRREDGGNSGRKYYASGEGNDSRRYYSGRRGGGDESGADVASRKSFDVRAGDDDNDEGTSRDSDVARARSDSESESESDRSSRVSSRGDAPMLPRATPSVIEWLKGALAVAMSQHHAAGGSSLRATSDRLSRHE